MKSNNRLIGLTGGIATGKTTVSDYLADKYHLPVLDADVYAREALAADSPILPTVLARYGKKIQAPDGKLDRTALGDIVFNNSSERKWLESQIHPFVRQRFARELRQMTDSTIVLAIPLLFEANLTDMVTEIWVVHCDRAQQIARLQQRNGLTVSQARARIDSQLPLADKIAMADVVIYNDGKLQNLYERIDRAIASSKQ